MTKIQEPQQLKNGIANALNIVERFHARMYTMEKRVEKRAPVEKW